MFRDEEKGDAPSAASAGPELENHTGRYHHRAWRRLLCLLYGCAAVAMLCAVGFPLFYAEYGVARNWILICGIVEAALDVVIYVSYWKLRIGHVIAGVIKVAADLLLAVGLSRLELWNEESLVLEKVLPAIGPWVAGRITDLSYATALLLLPVTVEDKRITFEHYLWLGTVENRKTYAVILLFMAGVVEAAIIAVPTFLLLNGERAGDETFMASFVAAGGDAAFVAACIAAVGGFIIFGPVFWYILQAPCTCCEYEMETEKCGGICGCWNEWTGWSVITVFLIQIPAVVYEFGLTGGALAGAGAIALGIGQVYELVANWQALG